MTEAEAEGLIDRLAKATGPDRELSVEIATYLFDIEWRPYTAGKRVRILCGYDRSTGDTVFYGKAVVPHYTASIDAALTLVPEGYGSVSLSINERDQSSARFAHPYVFGNAATPAIAICIAALKTRLAKAEEAH